MRSPFPRQLILGHRGSPRRATENTLRSFALALEEGADGVELDVRRTRDGHAVVVHDPSLERTMGQAGDVAKLSWHGIERLTGGTLPSLQQAIAWAAAAGAWLNLELKTAGIEEAVVQQIREARLEDRIVISSFDEEIVAKVGSLGSRAPAFLLTRNWTDAERAAVDRSRARGVCLRVDATSDAVLRELADRRLPVIAWTVNDAGELRRLLRAGVAAVITDDPAMGAAARDAVEQA